MNVTSVGAVNIKKILEASSQSLKNNNQIPFAQKKYS